MPREAATTIDQAQRTRRPNALPTALAAAVGVLAAALAGLHDGSFFTLSVRGTDRYVQFFSYDVGLRGETIGNTYLSGHGQLGVGDLGWLAHHGWHDPDEGGNHWREWEPANPLAAATVAVVTLHLIHWVEHPSELEIDSNDDRTLQALATLSV